jgi:hypothetical protein
MSRQRRRRWPTFTSVLDREQLNEFAERGFVEVPRAVPVELVTAASGVIDGLVEATPPGPEVRGPYNYFPESAQEPALLAQLTESATTRDGVSSCRTPGWTTTPSANDRGQGWNPGKPRTVLAGPNAAQPRDA